MPHVNATFCRVPSVVHVSILQPSQKGGEGEGGERGGGGGRGRRGGGWDEAPSTTVSVYQIIDTSYRISSKYGTEKWEVYSTTVTVYQQLHVSTPNLVTF